MKLTLKLFVNCIPVAVGILLTIVSFVFIIQMDGFDHFDPGNFFGFVFFGLLGIPSIFVGLNIICGKNIAPDFNPHNITSDPDAQSH